MRQRQYTKEQELVLKILKQFEQFCSCSYGSRINEVVDNIKKEYDIQEPYLTIREYVNKHSFGAYHTFYVLVSSSKIAKFDTISSLVEPDLMWFLPYIDKYYVVDDKQESEGATSETYHCDHYLELRPKED